MNKRTLDDGQSSREAQLRAEVQAAQEFIDKILTSLNDHYVIFDNDWRYVFANDAASRTLGIPKDQLIGKVIWDLFPESVGNQFYQELHLARAEQRDFVSEHYYQLRDMWFENHFYVLPDGVAVLSIDITARKLAEQAQNQSEQMLAFALQSADMVAWEWDIERKEVKFSRADNKIYGTTSRYSTDEGFKTVYPDDLAAHRQKVMQCVRDGKPYHSNYRIIRPDNGAIAWVDEWGFAFHNEAGEAKKLFGVAMESTERKEGEERLQVLYQLSEAVNRAEAVEQIYELALAGLERVLHVRRAAILLFDRKGEMRLQAWRGLSERYRALTDGQLPRFVSESDPVPVLIPNVAQTDLRGQQQNHLDEGIHAIAFIPLIEQQQLIGKFMLYYEQPHTFTDAEVQWAQTIARHVSHALERKLAETRLQRYAKTLEDLNHIQLSLALELDMRKLAQMVTDAATELSGAQYGAFFYNAQMENSGSGQAESGDDSGKPLDRYRLYTLAGATHEDFANFPIPHIPEIFSPTLRGEGILRVGDITQDARFGQHDPTFGATPGRFAVCSYMAVPVVARSGEVLGGLIFGHSKCNIFTEQVEQLVSGIASQAAITLENARLYAQVKEREAAMRELNSTLEQRVEQRTAELQRSNRELDQFAYVASHDLKAPLRAISHLADWIAQDAAESLPVPSQEHLGKLQGRVQRMETLLDDLLVYSRAGRQRHPAEVVDCAELVRNVAEIVAPSAGFTVNIVGTLPTIRVERVPLETIFRNLIGNAIKHHDHDGTGIVEVSACELDDFIEFCVKDDGPGIAPEFHQRIFEIFQTLKPRDVVEGSGMGLAVVKRTVESRGGKIEVESRVGEGTTFCFTWPKTVASLLEH